MVVVGKEEPGKLERGFGVPGNLPDMAGKEP